jgi:S-adenosylmethionine uptake transporter
MHPQSNLIGALLSLSAFGIYATNDVIVKFLGASYSPFQTIFFSVLFGFPLVLLMLIGDKSDGNLVPRHPFTSVARALLTVACVLCGFYAFSVLPLAEAYPIFFATPILITIIAIPMLGEKVGIHRGVAVAVGLIAVIVVVRPGNASFGLGHMAAITAAVLGAFNSVLMRKVSNSERSVVMMLYPMIANLVVAAIALPFVYKPMPVTHLGLSATMSALGFCAGLLAISAYRRAPAVIVAPMQYSQIIWATIYGTLLFNEKPDIVTIAGTAVIIGSGLYIVLREGTPDVSKNRPVLQNRSRLDTGLMPRLTLWSKIFEGRSKERASANDQS